MAVNDLPPTHAAHDELLIVAFAAGDLHGAELVGATELVASCAHCARLVNDVGLIRAATGSLPAPRRTREFRLTEADASRLRPRSWRRLLVPLASPRFAFTQPLAAGLATIGIVGILLASVPGLLSSGASTGAFVESGGGTAADRLAGVGSSLPSAAAGVQGAAPSPAAPSLAAPVPAASQEAGSLVQSQPPAAPSSEPGPEETAAPAANPSAETSSVPGASAPGGSVETSKNVAAGRTGTVAPEGGVSPLAIVSLALLLGGLALFLLRWSARRLTDA